MRCQISWASLCQLQRPTGVVLFPFAGNRKEPQHHGPCRTRWAGIISRVSTRRVSKRFSTVHRHGSQNIKTPGYIHVTMVLKKFEKVKYLCPRKLPVFNGNRGLFKVFEITGMHCSLLLICFSKEAWNRQFSGSETFEEQTPAVANKIFLFLKPQSKVTSLNCY